MTSQEHSSSTQASAQPITEEALRALLEQYSGVLSATSVSDAVVVDAVEITSASDVVSASGTQAPVPATVRPTMSEFVLGSVLVLTDQLGERIVIDTSHVSPTTRTPESVFRPESEFGQLIGNEGFRQTRYLALGVSSDARKALGNGLEWFDDTTDAAGRAFWRVAGPVWNSRLLGPVRRPVQRWQVRGEAQVREWMLAGMVQEERSRVVAAASLNNLVTDSVSDITNSSEVQDLVQEVVRSQSVSMVTVILQEVRQRLISADIWVQGIFGTAYPSPLAGRSAYLDDLAVRRPQHTREAVSGSMAGFTAGFVTRFVALTIDILLLLLVYSITSATVTGTLQLFGLMGLASRFLTSGSTMATIVLILIAVSGLLIVSGYCVISWHLTGETIGDGLMGIQVVSPDGGPLSFGRSIRRMIGYFIAAIPLFLGFIWVLFNKQRRGWHDMIAGTYVVYDWPAHPDEAFLSANVARELAKDAAVVARENASQAEP